MSLLRMGMIGAGAISGAHLSALHERGDTEIRCIADANIELARKQAERYGIGSAVDSFETLNERDDLDAVIVAIPTRFHREAVLGALRGGKHVLCEKPMARTEEECREMIELAGEAGRILQIAFVRRFDPGWGKIRELVRGGACGRPCLWRRVVAGSAPQPPTYGLWYTDSLYSDGPLAENGSHDLDFVCHTFGRPVSVTADSVRLGRLGDVEDTVSLLLTFEGGDRMLFSWSWALPRGASGFGGLDVVGPEGLITSPVKVEGNEYSVTLKRGEDREEHPVSIDRDRSWYVAQIDNFVRSIAGDEEPRAGGEDGLLVQRIIEAAFESARTKKSVEL